MSEISSSQESTQNMRSILCVISFFQESTQNLTYFLSKTSTSEDSTQNPRSFLSEISFSRESTQNPTSFLSEIAIPEDSTQAALPRCAAEASNPMTEPGEPPRAHKIGYYAVPVSTDTPCTSLLKPPQGTTRNGWFPLCGSWTVVIIVVLSENYLLTTTLMVLLTVAFA